MPPSGESFSDLIDHCEQSGQEELIQELECLKGSYSTLFYNHTDVEMEYGDHLMHLDEEISELEDRNLPVYQHYLHNYISSSYSFQENVETALSRLDQSLTDVYESSFYESPRVKAMRGLRNYAQHYRVLPLSIKRVETDPDYPELHNPDHENTVVVNVDELVASKDDWRKETQDYFFEVEDLDFLDSDMDLNTIEAVDAHYGMAQGLKKWIFEQLYEVL